MSAARRILGLSLIAVAGVAACTAGQLTGTPTQTPAESSAYPSVIPPGEQLYKVDSVYDGDTLRVFLPSGESAPVRVLGIDAPEMQAPRPPEDIGRSDAPSPGPECGAVEARDAARAVLLGESVQLTEDPEQPGEDQYQRLLRYVTLPDGKDLAESLLFSGWVQVYTKYPVARTPDYLRAQGFAQSAESGGWAMCGWEN